MRSILLLAALIAPAMAAGGDNVHMSVAASAALTSANYVCAEITEVPTTDVFSRPLPKQRGAYLLRLEGKLTTIVTAVTITWFISKSASDADKITNLPDVPIEDVDANGTTTISSVVNTGWTIDGESTPGSLWMCAIPNAGSADMVTRLYWEAR